MRRIFLAAALAVLIVLLILLGVRRRSAEPTAESTGEAPPQIEAGAAGYTSYEAESMGTTIRVEVPAGPPGAAAAGKVFAAFREYDEMMSEWKPGSPLSEVNRRAGEEDGVAVPKPLFKLLERSVAIADLTGGAFDPTWAALWGLWDFKSPNPHLPDSVEMDERLDLIDYTMVTLDPGDESVWLHEPGMLLGLGGIAKGYALDRAGEILRAAGMASFLVQAGGQVLVHGQHQGRPWRVGIRDPRGESDDYFATLDVENVSVSTSGDYESYFILNGKRYHHIIDTRTGWPAVGTRSVTILAADATLADALSTAVFVLGPEVGMDVVEGLTGVEAVIVDADGQVHTTEGVRQYMTVHHAPKDGL